MKNYLYLILFILTLLSCNPKNVVEREYFSIVDFDILSNKKKELVEIADSLNFTFLQYDKQNFVGKILNFKITENYLFIVDQQQKLFVFKRNGNLFSVINKRGKGPEEYIQIEDFTITPNEKFVVILDPYNSKVLKYDISGNYINNYSIEYNHSAHISSIGDNRYCLYQSARFSDENVNLFITDSTFNTVKKIKYPGNGEFLRKIPYLLDVNWYNYENSIYYKEVVVDTIYKMNLEKLTFNPHFAIDLGKWKMPDKYYTNTKYYQMSANKFYQIGKICESENYLFLNIFYENNFKYFIYKKKDEPLLFEVNSNELPNQIGNDISFWPDYIYKNVMFKFIEAGELYDKLKSTPFSGEIKKNMELNDNPILMSCKIK